MNKAFILLTVGLLSIGAASCKRNKVKGEGPVKTENRAVSNFSAVQLSAPVNATIEIGNVTTPTLQISGYANVLAKIKAEVKGNTLVIEKDGMFDWDLDKDVIVTITMPAITSLGISGAADAKIKGKVTGTDFNLKVSGAGDVIIENINTTNFTSSLSGAGDLEIQAGNVANVSYKVTGAGDIDAYALNSSNVKAVVSGAGDINLTANQKLDVHISGAGSVSYKGKPVISSDINGVGSLEAVN